MKKSLLDAALKIARDTLNKHPEYRHFMHWSFIIQNNKIVDWSTNDSGIPPIHFGYRSRLQNNEVAEKKHAEFKVFFKCRGLINFDKRWDVINIRLNKTGELRMSKPCVCCYGLLKEFGCSTIYFTTNYGFAKVI